MNQQQPTGNTERASNTAMSSDEGAQIRWDGDATVSGLFTSNIVAQTTIGPIGAPNHGAGGTGFLESTLHLPNGSVAQRQLTSYTRRVNAVLSEIESNVLNQELDGELRQRMAMLRAWQQRCLDIVEDASAQANEDEIRTVCGQIHDFERVHRKCIAMIEARLTSNQYLSA